MWSFTHLTSHPFSEAKFNEIYTETQMKMFDLERIFWKVRSGKAFMKMCFWERTVMHCSPQQRAFWAIWWLWEWHMDRVDGSSPVQIHYSWTYHTTSPHPSFFLFPFSFFRSQYVFLIVNLQLLFQDLSDPKWLRENSYPFGSMPLCLICPLCLSLSLSCCVMLC